MKKQTFIKGSLILMMSVIGAKILGAFFKIPLTNLLGGVGMSYFSCAYSLFMPVYALTVTGISSAVAKMTAQSAALGLYDNIRKIRRTALVMFSAVGAFGGLLIFILAKPFSIISAGTSEAAAAVAMIAPAVLFGCITAVERGYYEGLSNMYPTALSQVAEGVVKVFGGLWLCGYVMKNQDRVMQLFPDITDIRAIAAAAGILGVTLSSLGAVLFFTVLKFFSRRNKECSENKNVMSRKSIARELASVALPVGISSVVTNLTSLIDMWTLIGCISHFGTDMKAPVGVSESELPQFIYGSFSGIAITIFNLVPSVTNMLGKGALTCVAADCRCGNREGLRKNAAQALVTAAVLAVPSAVGIALLAPEIMSILFPAQSDEVAVCIAPLRIMMPGMLFLCISFPVFSMLQAIGKAALPLKIMLIGTAVKLVGNLIFIPLIGVKGAALSTTLCYAVILVMSLLSFLKAADIRLSLTPFLKTAYSGAMCGGIAYLASSIARARGCGAFGITVLAALSGGIVYFVTLAVLLIFPLQRKISVYSK